MSVTNVDVANSHRARTIMDSALGIYYAALVSSLDQTGGTATAKMLGHTLEIGDSIEISGADQEDYNDTFTVTAITKDSFSFPISNNPDPATGTIIVECSSRSAVSTNCTGIQIEEPPSGTSISVFNRLHPDASWVQIGSAITDGSGSTIIQFSPAMTCVQVVKTGTGDCQVYATER